MDRGRPERAAALLDPAAARDDRRLHRGWLPDNGHQRAAGRTRYPPRVAPPKRRGQAVDPVLPVLRSGSCLIAAVRPVSVVVGGFVPPDVAAGGARGGSLAGLVVV